MTNGLLVPYIKEDLLFITLLLLFEQRMYFCLGLLKDMEKDRSFGQLNAESLVDAC